MTDFDWRPEQARKSLSRIFPGVEEKFANRLVKIQGDWQKFRIRLNSQWERLFTYLHALYGWQYDFFIPSNGYCTLWWNIGYNGRQS